MSAVILPAFARFKTEGSIIGRLLVGYGEVELALCYCVANARHDLDAVLKTMFRGRGETRRIDIADALGRKPYAAHNLENEFAETIEAVRHCLKIRNQFAHCQWYDDNSGKLAFVNLEEIARQSAVLQDLSGLTTHHVDTRLLMQQEQYFLYAGARLDYLNYEWRYRAGEINGNPFGAPQKLDKPTLHV